jgi:hypothetical protein
LAGEVLLAGPVGGDDLIEHLRASVDLSYREKSVG